jgi:hypothetical protein
VGDSAKRKDPLVRRLAHTTESQSEDNKGKADLKIQANCIRNPKTLL